MTSSIDTQSTVRGVFGVLLQTGFRPSLYTVVAGSYALNHVHSPAATVLNSYDAVSAGTPDSKASIRKHDTDVEFDLKITLDLSNANPAFPAGEELRVRVLPLGTGEPARNFKAMHSSSVEYRQPLFTSVEMINPATGAAIVPVAGQLQARLLHGGRLALVVEDLTAGPPPVTTALTAANLAGLFGAAPGTQLQISLRGQYRA